jgi:BASS family bile acid:Na+ symporter
LNFDLFFPLLVTVTLAEMMFAMGLKLSFTQLAEPIRSNRWLVYRSVLANYILVPALTLLVIWVFQADPLVAAGLLILGVSPAAPYGPPFTVIARGNLALSTALMVILAASSALLAPLLLQLLLPLISVGDLTIRIDPLKLTGTLFVIQLLPLCLGLAIGQWKPALSARLQKPATLVSKILNLLMITAIAMAQFKVIMGTGLKELILMMILVAGGILVGWLLGWPGRQNRVTSSVIAGMRNMSLSMGIAATSFPGSPVMTTILAYSFVAGTGLLAYVYAVRPIRH